jgi:outer membrane protein OmpA-like peptidoglycan-associated protein
MTSWSSKIFVIVVTGLVLLGCQSASSPTSQQSAAAPQALPAGGARYVVFFTPWSSRLEAGGHNVVANAARQIARYGSARVTVTGYTDPKGNDADSKRLSAARAQVVADALARNGVDPKSIVVEARGSAGDVAEALEGRRAVITVGDRNTNPH